MFKREKTQMKINRIRKATEEDGYTLTDFIRSAPIQLVDLVHIIKQTAASIQDSEFRRVVEFCISQRRREAYALSGC